MVGPVTIWASLLISSGLLFRFSARAETSLGKGTSHWPDHWELNHFDAEEECENRGQRLPTARELALIAQRAGAKGLLETQHKDIPAERAVVQAEIHEMLRNRFFPVYTLNSANQKVVDFYYSSEGYTCVVEDIYRGCKPPMDDMGSNYFYYFWTSSIVPDDPQYAYKLEEVSGSLLPTGRRGETQGWRCVNSR